MVCRISRRAPGCPRSRSMAWSRLIRKPDFARCSVGRLPKNSRSDWETGRRSPVDTRELTGPCSFQIAAYAQAAFESCRSKHRIFSRQEDKRGQNTNGIEDTWRSPFESIRGTTHKKPVRVTLVDL